MTRPNYGPNYRSPADEARALRKGRSLSWFDSAAFALLLMCVLAGPPNKCTRVRVLGDDEVAVKRIEVAHRGPTSTAEFMRESVRRVGLMNHGSHVTAAVKAVLAAYADALDAEAGDRS